MSPTEARVLLAAMDDLLLKSGRSRLALAALFPNGKADLGSSELRVAFDTVQTFVAAADVAALEVARSLAADQPTDAVLAALEHSQRCELRAVTAGRRLKQLAQFSASAPSPSDDIH